MTDITTDLPIYNTPIIDARGNISEVWWRFFSTLLIRTGDTVGVDGSVIQADVTLLQVNVALLQAAVTLLNRLVDELDIELGTVDGKAVQANDAVCALSQLLDLLGTAPLPDRSRLEALESAMRTLDEQSGVNAKANQVGDSLQAQARLLEVDGVSALAAANRLADSLQALNRLIEVAVTNPAFQLPRTLSLDYLDWDQLPAYVAQTSRMAWNPIDDTLNLHHSDGVTQQMGQELYGRILNNTGSTIPNGACLGINPATNSYVLFIANGTLSPITIVGVTTQAIPNATAGRITVWGRVRDIDTTGTPYGEVWTAGQILYVSTTIAGGFTNVKPTAPNLSLPIAQVLTVNASTGQIAVRPTVEQQLFYGQFAKTADQVPTAINTANAITWSSSLIANGVTIGAPTSRIVVANAGLYRFSASFQLTSGSASVKNVYLWYRKNGVDIANSTLITSMDSGTAIRAPARSLLISLATGDYIELMWAADDTNVTLDAIPATAFAPAAPAALLTVQQEQQ